MFQQIISDRLSAVTVHRVDTVIALCNALHASVDYVVSDDISTRDDEIMTDIRAQLVKLTPDEKQYFYHMIVSYIQLKEENARAQKKEP